MWCVAGTGCSTLRHRPLAAGLHRPTGLETHPQQDRASLVSPAQQSGGGRASPRGPPHLCLSPLSQGFPVNDFSPEHPCALEGISTPSQLQAGYRGRGRIQPLSPPAPGSPSLLGHTKWQLSLAWLFAACLSSPVFLCAVSLVFISCTAVQQGSAGGAKAAGERMRRPATPPHRHVPALPGGAG